MTMKIHRKPSWKLDILDPISIPVVFGEDQPDFSFGDGITPNLTAVLELDQEVDEPDQEVDELSFTAQPARIHDSQGQDGASQKAHPATATLPAAYGARPLAPVRPRGG